MSPPFGFGRRARTARTEKLLGEIGARLAEIEARFRQVEESLGRSEARDRQQPQQPQIQIENVHIHQPVLEKLEFRLDALDIEQLSGSLNLGNNFGAKWAGVREPESGAPTGKSASAASGGTHKSGAGGARNAGGAGRNASGAAGKSGAGRAGDADRGVRNGAGGGSGGAGPSGRQGGDLPADAALDSEAADDGLRRTSSGYRWNNRR